MSFPPPDFDVFEGSEFGNTGSLAVEIWLQDSDGNPANVFWPDEPDFTFTISSWPGTGNWELYGNEGFPDVDPNAGGPSGALGSAFLSMLKTFFTDFNWTDAYDWGSISVSTPVTLYKIKIQQMGAPSVTDVTPS